MAMNLKQFRYVQILSQEGSFSRAADILNISQPSLSQYIKKIEQQVGMELFSRLNGEVRLTDAGQIYLDAGKKILELEHRMETRLSDLNAFRGGTVTIGISPYRSVHLIPDVLREFDRLYPDMKLIVKERSGGDLIEDARNGEFDLCVISLPVEDKAFECIPFQREETVIAVNRRTALYQRLSAAAVTMEGRHFPAVSLRMTEAEAFAMLDEDMLMRTATDLILEQYQVQVREKIRLSSNEALLSIVKSGVCAAFVPSGITGLADPETAFFSIQEDTPSRIVGILYRKEQYLSEPMRELIRIFRFLCEKA